MELRFYAREGHVVRSCNAKATGQFVPALGRTTRKGTAGIEMPATKEPFCCDGDSAVGRKLLRRFRQTPDDQPMWPADIETAAACGVQFVEVELQSYGEFAPKKQPSIKAKSAKGDDK